MGEMINEFCSAAMLLCFGASWPFNIIKLWKARSTKNASLPFYLLIWGGYVIGLVGRIAAGKVWGAANWAFWVYVLDLIMLSAALAVYARNRIIEKKEQQA